ncbi:hypothetical protein FA13DRAFT_189614 [Coprinellus micaceus]|uniref:Uncharacterized protein n=1 Tax=Coprinellus micaceus TaxID=71717 RepID=A0A4Y7TG54_COPMI|nr:hypothetical protein FA13DRAFT_189614 [Coprinellus micaceus]
MTTNAKRLSLSSRKVPSPKPAPSGLAPLHPSPRCPLASPPIHPRTRSLTMPFPYACSHSLPIKIWCPPQTKISSLAQALSRANATRTHTSPYRTILSQARPQAQAQPSAPAPPLNIHPQDHTLRLARRARLVFLATVDVRPVGLVSHIYCLRLLTSPVSVSQREVRISRTPTPTAVVTATPASARKPSLRKKTHARTSTLSTCLYTREGA